MKKILNLFFVSIIAASLFTACDKKEENISETENLTEVEKLMRDNEYIIVDVRTKSEYLSGHLVGAINIPYDQISEDDLDKDKLIFVYCKSGSRSQIAYETLTELGYSVYDLGAYSSINLPKE